MALMSTLAVTLIVMVGSTQAWQYVTNFVRPDDNPAVCINIGNTCDTLSNFIEDRNDHFVSNSLFIFLPGIHWLTENVMTLHVQNVTNLSFQSENCENDSECPTPVIQCENDGGFDFENITNLSMKNLIFKECGRILLHHPYPTRVTLRIETIWNLILSQLTIEYSTGVGLLAYRLYGTSTIDNCLFQYNQGTSDYIGGNAIISYVSCSSNNASFAMLTITSTQFLYGDFVERNDSQFASGLTLYLFCSHISVKITNTTFKGNNAYPFHNETLPSRGGNLALIYHNKTMSSGNIVTIAHCYFINGTAKHGGGIYVNFFVEPNTNFSNKVNISDSLFEQNHAYFDGGAVYFQLDQGKTSGEGNTDDNFFVENCNFTHNSVSSSRDAGIAISIVNFYLSQRFDNIYTGLKASFMGLKFANNILNVTADGTISSASAVLYLSEQRGKLLLKDCHFENNTASAISAFHSYLTFEGNVTIRNNSGIKGGGLLLCEASLMILSSNTVLTVIDNYAKHSGGGIYVDRTCAQARPLCFFRTLHDDPKTDGIVKNPLVHLINNSAEYAGSQLYGGDIEICYLPKMKPSEQPGLPIFEKVFYFEYNKSDLSFISSDPTMICFCVDNQPNCSIKQFMYEPIFSGETVHIPVTIVGQHFGAVPGTIQLSPLKNRLLKNSAVAYILSKAECKILNYTLSSVEEEEVVVMHNNGLESRYLHVPIKNCPLGFEVDEQDPRCHCSSNLLSVSQTFKCNIENQTIFRPDPFWIGYSFANESSIEGSVDGVIWHELCPLDYCVDEVVYIHTSSYALHSDMQCALNHTGLLCGGCKPGLSAVLATSSCKDCKSYTVVISLLLIVVFAVGGIVLVVILFVCNLTVSEGTMSGMIFYANVFAANSPVLVPSVDYPFLTKFIVVFLSWLNLDPGIEMCFYDGLTQYDEVWGYFIYPVYLWAVVGLIVFLCRKSNWATHLIGKNAVPVLATVFLLSYTKVNQGIIYSLSYTTILYPANGTTIPVKVWLMDPTVRYLSGKHIPLFITGVVFGMLSVTYTIFVLFVRPLQQNSHYRCLNWVNKLKPLIDAYSCPHIMDEKKQFWNGLLLLSRIILFIVFAGFGFTNPQFNLASTIVCCSILFTVSWSVGGIYKLWYLNLLSSSLLLNLIIVSTTTLYFLNNVSSNNHQKGVTLNLQVVYCYTSPMIAAVTFMGIMMYHTHKILKQTVVYNKLCYCIKGHQNMRRYSRSYRSLSDVITENNPEHPESEIILQGEVNLS